MAKVPDVDVKVKVEVDDSQLARLDQITQVFSTGPVIHQHFYGEVSNTAYRGSRRDLRDQRDPELLGQAIRTRMIEEGVTLSTDAGDRTIMPGSVLEAADWVEKHVAVSACAR